MPRRSVLDELVKLVKLVKLVVLRECQVVRRLSGRQERSNEWALSADVDVGGGVGRG